MEEKLKSLWLQLFPKLWQKFSASGRISSVINSNLKLQSDSALTSVLYQMMAFGLSEYLGSQQDRIHRLESIENPPSLTPLSESAGTPRKPLSPSSKINSSVKENANPDPLRTPPKASVPSSSARTRGTPERYQTPSKGSASSQRRLEFPEDTPSPSLFSDTVNDRHISPFVPAKVNLAPSKSSSDRSPIIGKSNPDDSGGVDSTNTDESTLTSLSQRTIKASQPQSKQITKANATRSLSRRSGQLQPGKTKQQTLFEMKKALPRPVERDVSQSEQFSGGFRKPPSPKKKFKSKVAVNLLQKIDQCTVEPSRTKTTEVALDDTHYLEDVTCLEDDNDDDQPNIVTQMKYLGTQEGVKVGISSLESVDTEMVASDRSQFARSISPTNSIDINIPDEELDIDDDAAETAILESQATNPTAEVKMEIDETTVAGVDPPYTQVNTSQTSGSQRERNFGDNTLQLVANFNRPVSTSNDTINEHDDGKPRTKLEKLIILGRICPLCRQYYEGIRFVTMTTQQIDKVINNCSRHASRKKLQDPLPNTPPDYWATSMPSTFECVKRGMIHVEPEKYKAKPKPPRKYRMD